MGVISAPATILAVSLYGGFSGDAYNLSILTKVIGTLRDELFMI